MPTVLLVYGTLKRGHAAHDLLAGQHFLGPAVTAPHYRLVDLGPYPGLVPDGATGLAVSGELWEVSDEKLKELDAFEGCPTLYWRGAVEVADHAGPVEAYFYARSVPPRAPTGAAWPLR
ncbi:MAG: gamma-glutamylcyclotransferase family protein [Gemmataceae bacterium]